MAKEKYPELQSHIQFVLYAHQNLAKASENTVRGFDNETPYSVHPVWCATTIAAEPSLSRDLRIEGAIVLLYHDVNEDTTAVLPDSLPLAVRQSIEHMTFLGGMEQEMKEIWDKEPKIRLFKLYDKISNLLDATWMSHDYRKKYVNHTKNLLIDIEQQFGSLNITRIAHAIVD